MDKKENNILEDILNEDTEIELPVIPETLKSETSKEAENTEEIENTEKIEDTEEIKEPEEPEKIEKKEKTLTLKIKSIKNFFIIFIAAVLIIGGGLFVFWRLEINSSNYIVNIDGKKITTEEFKLTLMLNAMTGQSNEDEKQYALDSLIHYTILNKMANEKNAVLSDEEKKYLATYVENVKNMLDEDNIKLSVSEDRFEFLVNYVLFGSVQYILLDLIAEERNYTVNEEQIETELNDYKQNDKLLKYIITETEEEAKEAQESVNSGIKTPDEAVIEYCIDYNESYGVVKIDASQIGFPEDEMSGIMALKTSEASDPINLGGTYAVFIAATETETEEWVRESYIFHEKLNLYDEEYAMYENDTKIKVNDKAFSNFDTEKFWNELSG